MLNAQRRAYDNCLRRLNNLFDLKISPMNVDGSLLSDGEYAERKSALMLEKARLQEVLNDIDGGVGRWLEAGEGAFEFAKNARGWFARGTDEERATILRALGSNLTLKEEAGHRAKKTAHGDQTCSGEGAAG